MPVRAFSLFLVLLATLPACSLVGIGDADPELQFDGIVTYADISGGVWLVRDDDGTSYEPGGLPETYREEGLRVRIWADVVEDAASIYMAGTIIQIERIERL